MSDCSNSRMEPYTPILGHIGWGGGHRPTPLSYARYVNGEERVAEYIELDGVRYVPERMCSNEGEPLSFVCSVCGCDVSGGDELGHNSSSGAFKYCPNCGALVVSA